MQYEIPINWQSTKRYTIEAETLQEATEQALNIFLSEPDEYYIEDSFEIDNVIEEEYPNELLNYLKLLTL